MGCLSEIPDKNNMKKDTQLTKTAYPRLLLNYILICLVLENIFEETSEPATNYQDAFIASDNFLIR